MIENKVLTNFVSTINGNYIYDENMYHNISDLLYKIYKKFNNNYNQKFIKDFIDTIQNLQNNCKYFSYKDFNIEFTNNIMSANTFQELQFSYFGDDIYLKYLNEKIKNKEYVGEIKMNELKKYIENEIGDKDYIKRNDFALAKNLGISLKDLYEQKKEIMHIQSMDIEFNGKINTSNNFYYSDELIYEKDKLKNELFKDKLKIEFHNNKEKSYELSEEAGQIFDKLNELTYGDKENKRAYINSKEFYSKVKEDLNIDFDNYKVITKQMVDNQIIFLNKIQREVMYEDTLCKEEKYVFTSTKTMSNKIFSREKTNEVSRERKDIDLETLKSIEEIKEKYSKQKSIENKEIKIKKLEEQIKEKKSMDKDLLNETENKANKKTKSKSKQKGMER